MKEKIFLVKREVKAKNIREAMTKKGRVYSIEEVSSEPEEEENEKPIGFK